MTKTEMRINLLQQIKYVMSKKDINLNQKACDLVMIIFNNYADEYVRLYWKLNKDYKSLNFNITFSLILLKSPYVYMPAIYVRATNQQPVAYVPTSNANEYTIVNNDNEYDVILDLLGNDLESIKLFKSYRESILANTTKKFSF